MSKSTKSNTSTQSKKSSSSIKKKCDEIELDVIVHNIFINLTEIIEIDGKKSEKVKKIIFDTLQQKKNKKKTFIDKIDGKKLFYESMKEEVGKKFENLKGIEKANAVRKGLKEEWDSIDNDEKEEYEEKASKQMKKELEELEVQLKNGDTIDLKVKGKKGNKEKKPKGKSSYNYWMSKRNEDLKKEGFDYETRRKMIKEEYEKIKGSDNYEKWKKEWSDDAQTDDDVKKEIKKKEEKTKKKELSDDDDDIKEKDKKEVKKKEEKTKKKDKKSKKKSEKSKAIEIEDPFSSEE